MKSKNLILLSACVGISFAALLIILNSANLPNKESNGFIRKYKFENIRPVAERNIFSMVRRISGYKEDVIYFSGRSPQWVLATDYSFSKVDTLLYNVGLSDKLRDPGIYVDSPNVFMYANEISYLLKGTINSKKLDTVRLKTDLITRNAQISTSRLAVRSIDSSQTTQLFKVIDCISGDVLHQSAIVSSKYFGGFDVDGILRFDRKLQQLYYIQMFSNEIFCMDTSLNVIYKSHTIDTMHTNKVVVDLVTESGTTKIMATQPRAAVNKFVDVADGKIYVVSGLRGDNEKLASFNRIIPIDIYSGINGEYLFSISIPKTQKEKLLDLKVFNNIIGIVYEGGYCALYKIPS